MSRIASFVTLRTKPGRRDEVLAHLGELVDVACAEEPGTELYVMHAAADDPDVILTYEVFADEDALDRHSRSPAVARVLPLLGSLVEETSTRIGTPIVGKGLPPR